MTIILSGVTLCLAFASMVFLPQKFLKAVGVVSCQAQPSLAQRPFPGCNRQSGQLYAGQSHIDAEPTAHLPVFFPA